VTKQELKRIIAERFPKHKMTELNSWVFSEDFETDLDQFIESDLEHQLKRKQKIDVDALDSMASNILKKSSIKTSKGIKPDFYHSTKKARKFRLQTLYKFAATLLVVAIFSFVAYYFTGNQVVEEVQVKSILKENLRGRKSTIFLRDGSIVYLNAESKIHYPEVFSDSLRVVHLEGEAFFDISRDESRPFVVFSNDVKVSVLGTSFNINAFNENDYVKISLNSGRVSVENRDSGKKADKQKVQLQPGQSVSYSPMQNVFTDITNFDPGLDLGWKDGKIVFKNADIETMISRFERWYNVDFVLQNKPYFEWSYTGEFENQTLQDVLESLSFSQSFEYRFNHNKVELVFKPN